MDGFHQSGGVLTEEGVQQESKRWDVSLGLAGSAKFYALEPVNPLSSRAREGKASWHDFG